MKLIKLSGKLNYFYYCTSLPVEVKHSEIFY